MTSPEKIKSVALGRELDADDIRFLLSLEDTEDIRFLGALAYEVKKENVSNRIYYRGLIEFSNICSKDCFYCGIRKSNAEPRRFTMTPMEIIDAAMFAYRNRYGSVVLQSGERKGKNFTNFITSVIRNIRTATDGNLGITLSCGEQSRETYKEFFNAGAHRYLLRIETSDRELYGKFHPRDRSHDFDTRLKCLGMLKETGFQVGTGVMVGLPFQTMDHLVKDLLFIREIDADMIGMGPYIEHSQTPLYEHRDQLWPQKDRLMMTLKMIAVLRIMMKDINIASATALQAIDGFGRERALKYGANVIMPSLTPREHRKDYLLYEDKPCIEEDREECKDCLETRIRMVGDVVGYGEWGDSLHFRNRNL
ncbi:MAG: [FeFe] hydrogenase H-cluster radical SAM maturase HydE [Bacteroidota bacterium]|jgi:biotin synthase